MATTTIKNVTSIGLISVALLLGACNDKNTNANQNAAAEEAVKTDQTPIADFNTDPNLDIEVRKFLKVLNSGGTPLEKLTPKEAKDVLVNAQASVKVDLSGIEVSEKTITNDGLTISLNIVRPKGIKEKLPVFIFIHGGGWILGDFPTHERLVRDLVVHSGFAAVFVNYTRTPEAQYPVAINEIFAATKWVAAHGDEINVDGTNMAIVGNSVGGNMTAVTALKAKENNGPKIKGLIMMWPIVDSKFDTDSYKRFGQDRFLTVPVMKWMYDFYIPDPAKRNVIYASPLQASLDQLKGLPPTLIQTAENDILRDEGEAFGRKLSEAGVKVSTVRYVGMIHDFGLLNGLATLPSVNALTVQGGAQLKEYLKK
ncbi:alpha/beta hydrolase [Flavobacterium psychroterrae]|uniref:Alpha/beta hydrolase n=1 Tax=Flavobacterium psychroterrae TaxID=2133767 RepID=A0ABS5PE74_9FLAO|nr:alpha/beta hydrolase [Flavobacterium psychroterrae]MBS7232603.1 alpha/beta hydrolase [Flavobacterium psychroterrae]